MTKDAEPAGLVGNLSQGKRKADEKQKEKILSIKHKAKTACPAAILADLVARRSVISRGLMRRARPSRNQTFGLLRFFFFFFFFCFYALDGCAAVCRVSASRLCYSLPTPAWSEGSRAAKGLACLMSGTLDFRHRQALFFAWCWKIKTKKYKRPTLFLLQPGMLAR
ncbi:hypothetical protein IWZ03DRAFT_120541 [Phyllosticta citriasiana]|uniref:Uncharacterized protein n=1 Tax=Phyllosticta citriasiana TaxID=595635 RepID=A0ABR1KYF6_9PEZI